MASGIKSLKNLNCKANIMLIATPLAVCVGIALGLSLRLVHLQDGAIAWIRIWGELFLRMFSAITLPIILSCVIVGITKLEGRKSGALGLVTVIYMLFTTSFCILIAVLLHFLIRPGKHSGITEGELPEDESGQSYADLWFDILRNLIPDNLVSASMETVYTSSRLVLKSNDANASDAQYIEKKELKRRYGINSLGIVFVAIIFACAIRVKEEKAKPLRDFFEALLEVIFSVVNFIMWYSPLGVCCIIAGALLVEDDLLGTMKLLLFFLITVISGLAIHAFLFLPLMYLLIVRKNPLLLYPKIADGLLAGVAPPSNVVTMTVLLDKADRRFGTKSDVANFVLPVVVIFVKNGSTIFIVNSTLFIAQSEGISLNILNIIMISCLVTILTAAVPNIPSGSIIIILLISATMQLPVQDRLGSLLTVEWLLDRLRTLNNALGMAFGVPIIDRISQVFTPNTDNNEQRGEGNQPEKQSLLGKDCVIDIDERNGEKFSVLICDDLPDCPETVV